VATANSVALAENRRVEVFFFRGPVSPPPVDPCPSGGCAEYPQWVERSTETIDINNEHETTLLVVDELGQPLASTRVRLLLADGRREDIQTDAKGLIRPRMPPGSSFELTVDDAQEIGGGDSAITTSGQHFAMGGDGP